MCRADLQWLDEPDIFRVGQTEAHSDHVFYYSEREWREGERACVQSLNGKWKFHYASSPKHRPEHFQDTDYDTGDWDEISVPCHIELAGYGQIHYINSNYPWEGKVFRRPPYTLSDAPQHGTFSEAADNAVGSYVKFFTIYPEQKGKRFRICFEGVERAMYVWLNGQFIGYAEDSFTPSEFDLTPHICEGENRLAVQVYQHCTASYLEDQDFFRFFGIFRDVKLYMLPDIHLEDIWANPIYDPQTCIGRLKISIKLSGGLQGGNCRMELEEPETGNCLWSHMQRLSECMEISAKEELEVKAWSSLHPYLYTLKIYIYNEKQVMEEFIPLSIGFRKIEIKDKIICLNGKRLFICGVNRHEWNPLTGRVISKEDMDWDITCMKRNHINAVRTCHYPDQLQWYSLCDKNGIYVMAETNLESHGSWGKWGGIEPSWNVPGSFPKWRDVVMDRVKTNFEMLKNHPSVLFWSLGNESYAGDNLRDMHCFLKRKDPGRLVHYEGVVHVPDYRSQISDIESRMYAHPRQIEEYLTHNPDKPFILCEFMHSMGNSVGGLGEYMRLGEQYPMYQGGFIWDFIDQALYAEDTLTGQKRLCYGGDFDDRPSDNAFSGNGIVFADRKEKPAMQEVRYYYGKQN